MTPIAKLLLIVLVAFSAAGAKGQGVAFFSNQALPGPSSGWPDRLIRDVDGTLLSGANYIVELLYQDRTGTWVTHPIPSHFFDSSVSIFAGYWNGGNRTLVNAGGIPNPMNPIYALPVNMQVRVWDGGGGVTFNNEAVAAGMRWGTSDVFVFVEDFGAGVPDPTGHWMLQFRGFTLVPEPSAWALFALGTGWLVWRRNRKAKG